MFRKAILAAVLLLASIPLVGAPAAAANLSIVDGKLVAQALCAISMSDASLSECNILVDTTGTKIDPATKQLQQSTITNLGSPFQAGGSIGNTAFGISGTLPAFATTPTVYVGGLRYQLFGVYGGAGATANATGAAVGPVAPGAYTFSCVGTFGGGTVTLQVLGADGATFVTVPGISLTAAGSAGVVMPNIVGATGSGSVTAANARAVLAGATSPSVFCSLS